MDNNVGRNKNSSDFNQEDLNIALSLKLAVLGGLITTIGDAIAVYAANLAINEAVQDNVRENEDQQKLEQRLQTLEQKIELLLEKIENN
ncbi:hypothetical protein [Alkalihalobacillus pseudalcaliphilus]|uniref:hypothetical protein n=1 Tax=Alkalihalobacillus pseudalcaliphilus TaxID=79884 RepID=UPI00064DA7D1|nr:hypothetical protein [Alkalihalobacillus pseudalcaliphilus]KMK75614.1 hypothetical protein AB990_10020 [Alkalihalobacillus pseudalcaliphilus]